MDTFPTETLRARFEAGDWEGFTDFLVQTLTACRKRSLLAMTPATQRELDVFVDAFLTCFTDPRYEVPGQFHIPLLHLNLTISNLVAISRIETTDAALARLVGRPDALLRLLVLCSARNRTRLDVSALLDTHRNGASLWWCQVLRGYQSALSDPIAWQNLRYYLAALDARLRIAEPANEVYYGCSFIDETRDLALKAHVNEQIKAMWQARRVTVRNQPDPRRIAVVTGTWHPYHPVFRNRYDMVARLRDDYHLTLLVVGRDEVVGDPFHDVHRVALDEGLPPCLADNRFGLLIFPEVGMLRETLLLSNLRCAPVQVTTYGNPVSTGAGSEIDYFIAGAQVEALEGLTERYAERVVLLPRTGTNCLPPLYQRRGITPPDDPVIVNCSWHSQKLTWPLVQAMRALLDACPGRNVRFRIFANRNLSVENHLGAVAVTLHRQLGAGRVELLDGLPYPQYMEAMEQGTLALESFPFGGVTTVVDSLHLGQPVVALEGSRHYNRTASLYLRRAGCPDLVATSVDQFVAIAARLVNDPAFNHDVRTRLATVDADHVYHDPRVAGDFKRAVDYLITHHETLRQDGSRAPVVIAP